MHAEEIFGAQTWRWSRSPGQPQFFFRRISKFSPLSSDLLKNDNCNNDSCSCQDISNLSKMSKLFEKAIVAASILVFYFVCLTQCHPVTTKTRERKCKRKFSVWKSSSRSKNTETMEKSLLSSFQCFLITTCFHFGSLKLLLSMKLLIFIWLDVSLELFLDVLQISGGFVPMKVKQK